MKSISIYRKLVLLSVAVCTTLMTSCTDFLTIIPPDKIVHEQFWQTKDDVNGMLATSYLKLASSNAISRAIVWGELRSDDMTFESNKTTGDEIRYIVEANITEDNSYSRWGIFYQAINYANLVIEYAPLVVDRDPDFSQGNLDVVLGEMYAMRALCHFYLVRTFRDIPMAMSPAANDSELPDYVQVHPLDALDMIMDDLNIAEGLVMNSGSYAKKEENYGRITKNAVLAMKADVNLWRAAFTEYGQANGDAVASVDPQIYYTQCINNCQAVLDNMKANYESNSKKTEDLKKDEPYYLISNVNEFITQNEDYKSIAYNEIFVSENSRESIFELQIDKDLCSQSSGNADGDNFKGLQNMYGASDVNPQVEVPTAFLNKYEKDDLRKYSFTNKPHIKGVEDPLKIVITKYIANTSPATTKSELRAKDKVDANWIIYRQTDVMLMMAEALVLQKSATNDDIKKSFDIVNTINKRSRVDTTDIFKPLNMPVSVKNAADLVLDERVRELAFEGKRWYDLVRKALRENTTDNIKFVADKLTSGAATVKNKMVGIDNLFFPIHAEELRFNKNLKQNPAYNSEESSIGMNK